MLTYQRILLKTFNSVLGLHSQKLTTLPAFSFSSEDDKNKKYQFQYNFNREEYRGYIKKVQKANKQITAIEELEKKQVVPRRKRRVYDAPKHDTDLTGYAVWGLYDIDETDIKIYDHSMAVVGKVMLQPKWLVHALGQGIVPLNNRLSSHREHVFEDTNFSKFILYEYRNTIHYKKNIPDFDYDNQQHLRPQMRKIKRLEPEEFWQSQQCFEFRINCSSYAEHLKFVRWLKEAVEKRKTMESYDEMIDKKFGRSFCFNKKEDAELFQPRTPFIMHIKPESFEAKKEEKAKQTKQKPAGKGKKDKKADSSVSKPAEKIAENVAEKVAEKVDEKPVGKAVEQKPAFNFARKLEEDYRTEVKAQVKKAQSNEI